MSDLKVSGHTALTQEQIALMNRLKAAGAEMLKVAEEVNAALSGQYAHSRDDRQLASHLTESEPYKWFNDGRMKIQIGTMMLVRAVAQPEGI